MALPPTWTLFGDDHLPHRLQLLARMIERDSARQLADLAGMSLAEWRVLAYLGASGSASAAEAGAAFAVDRAEVSRAVARLEKAGLLLRRPDATHGKRLLLELTDAGATLFARIRDARVAWFRAIMEGIDADERALLDGLLARIAGNIDRLRP